MTTATEYKNDIDTVTTAEAIADCGCWVCCKPMARGGTVGRDHRALCHPERQQGAGDFGHVGCIDEAITSGRGSDYAIPFTPAPMEPAARLTEAVIDKLADDIASRAPDRVGKAITAAMDSVDTACMHESTPHERSTARRWVNHTKSVTEAMVTEQDITDGVEHLCEHWNQRLDERMGKPSHSGNGEGTNENSGNSEGQEAEGQDGGGQDDQNGEGAEDGHDGGTEGGGATEGEGEGEADENGDDSDETATEYVTHPEMSDAITEAKQEMDTRLMGVGVRLAEQFDRVKEGVAKVNNFQEAWCEIDDARIEMTGHIAGLEGRLEAAEKAAARQVRVIEIKRADKVTRLADEFYHDQFDAAIKMIGRGRDVFLTGPTGCGKTHMGEQIARALKLEFSSCSLTEGVDESNFWGRAELNKHGGMEFYDGQFVQRVEKGGLYLMDEVDAADPNVLLTINAITSNGFCNVPNRHQNPKAVRHEDFVLVCGANTIGKGADRRYVGRNQIDLATLNRFELIEMDYDRNLEANLVAGILEGSEAAEFCGWANNIRDKIKENRLEQVFGTRELIWRAEDRQLGDSYGELEGRVFAGWRDDEVAKVKAGGKTATLHNFRVPRVGGGV